MTYRECQDPWPSPQAAWADPPWQLTGRVVTVWFEVPRTVVEQVMSRSLWPDETAPVRARVRFYDIVFESLASSSISPTAPVKGRFREAVVAFQARAGDVAGEVSLFMWTDSDTYMLWGRDVFGWPLMRGQIDLSGSLWEGNVLIGGHGSAMLSAAYSSIALVIEDVGDRPAERAPAACWLTPRRVLHRAGLAGETREVLVVRPTVRDPGVSYSATGHVTLAFEAAHPLHALQVHDADYEVVDGVELVVGSDVDVL